MNVPVVSSPQTIWVIRHGRTALDKSKRSDGHIDLPLSDDGRRNIVAVYQHFLRGIPFSHIFSSPLKRTMETAHIIASGNNPAPPIFAEPGLNTWNLGLLAGGVKKQNKPLVEHLLKNPEEAPPNGDPYKKFSNDFDSTIHQQQSELLDGTLGGPILDVCSGSNCRRLSETSTGDRHALNVDEGGLFLLYPSGNGHWSAFLVHGGSNNMDEDS